MDDGDAFQARAATPSGWNRIRVSSIACIAIALAGCDNSSGPLRIALARDCMANLPAGPVATHYNDWDEVVNECEMRAWREASQCEGHEKECFAQLAQGTSASGQDAKRLEAKPAGPVPEGNAPNE